MEGIYQEFENENSIRSYPFSAGCVLAEDVRFIDAGIFIDAILYPVNPSGTLYLSSISEDGVFSVSDSSGVIMDGEASGNCVEMFDKSELKRHVGTLVASSSEALSEFAGRGVSRKYSADETSFAAGCVFPVIVDGVTSVSVGGTGAVAGNVSFENGPTDDIRVSSGKTEDGMSTIRFDVLPRPGQNDDASIRRIICVVDGETPFRIHKLFDPEHPERYGYNTVVLDLHEIDRESVCASAHRENEFEMADTCECRAKTPEEKTIPEAYYLEEVFIPPDEDGANGGVREGAENAFFLVVPNIPGHVNPLSITLEDGVVSPKTDDIEVVVDDMSAQIAEGEMLDEVTSKGVVIQVPGLSGGSE